MEELLRIIFRDILHKEEGIQQIKTIGDLYKVTWYKEKLLNVFGAMCGDQQGCNMIKILAVADEIYQEVRVNV